MEILETHDFKKPSRSRYTEAVDALCDKGAFAVRLTRGKDFPDNITAGSASGSVRQLIGNRGQRARCFIESDDALVVSLWKDGEGPKSRKRAKAKQPA